MSEREPVYRPKGAGTVNEPDPPKVEPKVEKKETPESQHERIARESGNTSWR